MTQKLERSRRELKEFCRRDFVQDLLLFGSAARKDFAPSKSRYDILVRFLPCTPREHRDQVAAWEPERNELRK